MAVLLFQLSPAPQLFTAPSPQHPAEYFLTPAGLESTVLSLNGQNAKGSLSLYLSLIRPLSDGQKAAFCDVLLQFNSKFRRSKPAGPSEWQQSFMYALAAETAPAWTAREAGHDAKLVEDAKLAYREAVKARSPGRETLRKEYESAKGAFRKKYGNYKFSSNNCRQWALGLYYDVLGEFLSPEASARLSKRKSGSRPRNFDWKEDSFQVDRLQLPGWNSKSPAEQERYRTGHRVAFIETDFSAGDLTTGCLVWVDRNSHARRSPFNPHVGIYVDDRSAGDRATASRVASGHVANTGKPVNYDTFAEFAKKARVVKILRLVSAGWPEPGEHAFNLLEEIAPWELPIRRSAAP